MGKKEELLEKLGESYGFLEQLVDNRVELFKIRATERSSKLIAGVVLALTMVVLLNFTVFCLLLAMGFGLAEWIGSPALAFLIMAVSFVLLAAIIYGFRQTIILNPTIRQVIKEFYPDEEEPSK